MVFKSDSTNLNFKEVVGFLTFKELEKYSFLKHAFSTRVGGISRGIFKSMNLSFKVGDNKNNVKENYKIFCRAVNISPDTLVLPTQVHGALVKSVQKNDLLRAPSGFYEIQATDGLITNLRGITLVIFGADCPTILMLDPVKKVIGAAHAGWRGTAQKIAQNLFESFINIYGSSKENIICAIGPGICKNCFQVTSETVSKFKTLDLAHNLTSDIRQDEKRHLDLHEINKQLLIQKGALENNIFKCDICTKCNNELLFSHRATNGKRGSNAAFISLA